MGLTGGNNVNGTRKDFKRVRPAPTQTHPWWRGSSSALPFAPEHRGFLFAIIPRPARSLAAMEAVILIAGFVLFVAGLVYGVAVE